MPAELPPASAYTYAFEIGVDETVVSMEQFPAALRERLVGDRNVVVVRADAALAHTRVERILDEARRAGAARPLAGSSR